MEVQYLVGLCCLRRHPDAVRVVLGDLVVDASSGTERDVDVTVLTEESGVVKHAMSGIEVKDEKRALDIVHVEQLCAKLTDMPGLATRAIVSSSGFTEPAVAKANYHGVELFEFRPWDQTLRHDFPLHTLTGAPGESVNFCHIQWGWGSTEAIAINQHDPDREKWKAAWLANAPLYLADRSGHTVTPTLQALLSSMVQQLVNGFLKTSPVNQEDLISRLARDKQDFEQRIPIHATIDAINPVYIEFGGELTRIHSVEVWGEATARMELQPTQYRSLVNKRTGECFAGAAISPMPNSDSLLALLLSPNDALVQVTQVHLTDSQRSQIRRLRLR